MIPTILSNGHDRILHHIHKYIGRKILPMEKITLVHFDAHPDLTIPDITSEELQNPKHTDFYDKISIESWIVPLIVAGHVDKIIWVKFEGFLVTIFSYNFYSKFSNIWQMFNNFRTQRFQIRNTSRLPQNPRHKNVFQFYRYNCSTFQNFQ